MDYYEYDGVGLYLCMRRNIWHATRIVLSFSIQVILNTTLSANQFIIDEKMNFSLHFNTVPDQRIEFVWMIVWY